MSSLSDPFDQFSTNFRKTFSHQPCLVIDVTQSNLPPSPWSGNNNHNTQICCQPFFDSNTNGGRYEIAFYDNGYAYYEALDGEQFRARLERLNPQMEFQDLKKVLEKIKQIFEQSVTNRADNQITVQLVNDDVLVVEIKGLIKSSILFKYMFKCQRREGEFYEANYVRQIVYCLAERKSRELELIKIIEAKDKELDDYRSQGTCQLQRSWLTTQPFDKDEFDKSTSGQVQQRHDDVLMHTLDLAFDREGKQLIEECLLRNEYRKQQRSSQTSHSSTTTKTSKKNISTQKRTSSRQQSGSSQQLNDDIVAAERRRHEELERKLQTDKEREQQIAKKKKRKFV
ncbi:unnamed protein product [Rotaria sordida]|uniref:Non-homologous end-joining factor 1 n=1 Tax=Rotaria sordida TaxID=392033 RepID=A0A814RZJ2_9BILA|nr:unnamed protein product [Rotaria sordida]CAF3897415.1 unnamed protein product [Rotaria sordida]